MTTTYSLYSPTAGQSFECASGNSYTASGAGLITGVILNDLGDLIKAGCTITGGTNAAIVSNYAGAVAPTSTNDSSQGYSVGSEWVDTTHQRSYLCMNAAVNSAVWALDANKGITNSTIGASSLVVTKLPITSFKNTAGTTIAASAGSGVFGISQTLGTSAGLTGEAASSSGPLTDTAVVEMVLPNSYIAGTNFNVLVNANTNGAGTFTTRTIGAGAYKVADDSTEGANLIATAAQTITGTAADYTFVVTGTTLNPGDRVMISVTGVITESGGVSSTIKLNSVRLT